MSTMTESAAGGGITTAITGRQEKTMSTEKTTNAAPVDGIVMPLCSVCRLQLTEQDKLAEQRVFKNGRLQYIELMHQKCSTDCMYCKHYEESVASPEDGWCHHCNESTSATETCDWHESA